MNIVEFLNAVSFDMMKRKEREKRLLSASSTAKSSKSPQVFEIALLQEILDSL